jgi:hypothetical protein
MLAKQQSVSRGVTNWAKCWMGVVRIFPFWPILLLTAGTIPLCQSHMVLTADGSHHG